jgi:hypothetical protein
MRARREVGERLEGRAALGDDEVAVRDQNGVLLGEALARVEKRLGRSHLGRRVRVVDPQEPVDVAHDRVGAAVPVEERCAALDALCEGGREAAQRLAVVRLVSVRQRSEWVCGGARRVSRHVATPARRTGRPVVVAALRRGRFRFPSADAARKNGT